MTTQCLSCTSKGVRYFPKGNFPRATSQVSISQVANSQMCYLPSNNFPKVRLGPLRHSGLQWGGRALRLGRPRGPSIAAITGYGGPNAAARTELGSCRLGNSTFGKFPLGKIPFGSCRLGKCLWESP